MRRVNDGNPAASLFKLHRFGVEVRFCCVSANVGIRGSEGADKIAKKAPRMTNLIDIPFSKGEVKVVLKKEIMKKWQDGWERDDSGIKYYKCGMCVQKKQKGEDSFNQTKVQPHGAK